MKRLIYLLIFLFSIIVVQGKLTCNYDTLSYITTTQDIQWSCYTYDFDSGKCYSIVNYQEDVLAMYPERQYVDGIGLIDYFQLKKGLVNIYFKTTDLYEGYNYTFQVVCGENYGTKMISFNRTIQLLNRNLDEVAYRGVWLKDNMSFIIGIGLVIIIMLIIVFAFKR